MAKANDKSAGDDSPPAPSPRYEVRTPPPNEGDPAYSGIHPVGIRFRDGVGETDDPIRAHACLEHGLTVIDRTSGKPAFGSEKAEKAEKKK